MTNAGLEEAEAGIKNARRNINNLRYADDTTLWHQRADTLKPCSQKTSQSNHTRTTALSNSMKLSHIPLGPPKTDGSWWRGLTECDPLVKGMANHFSILALRTP